MSASRTPAWDEAPGEAVDQFCLRGVIEIDHHIPAKYDLEWVGAGGLAFEEIELAECHRFRDFRADAIVAFLGAESFLEIGGDHFLWHLLEGFLLIDADTGFLEDAMGDVCGFDAPAPVGAVAFEEFGEGDGDGVGLFAGGAGGTPDVEAGPGCGGASLEELG